MADTLPAPRRNCPPSGRHTVRHATGTVSVIAPESCPSWAGIRNRACRQGFTTRYLRAPRLFEDLALAHADGRFPKLLASLAKTDLIVLDDWGLVSLDAGAGRDLLELLDDRHGRRSTLITSQLPVEHWHDIIGDPTLADAILDRLVHSAFRITLKGESLRKRRAKPLTGPSDGE